MTADEITNYRLGEVETAVRDLERETKSEMGDLRARVDRLINVVTASAITVAVSVLVLALSVLFHVSA